MKKKRRKKFEKRGNKMEKNVKKCSIWNLFGIMNDEL